MTIEQLCELNDYNKITSFLLGRWDDRYDQFENRVEMLKKAKDVKFIKEYVEDQYKFLRFEVITNLIIAIGDDEFTKKCILNSDYLIGNGIIQVILSIKNKDIIYELLQDLSLNITPSQKYSIISRCGDEFIKKCLFSKELDLTQITLIDLIEHFGDKYVEEYIETNPLNLSKTSMLRLMQDLRDEEYIYKLLERSDLTLEEKVMIINEQSDEYKFNILKNNKIKLLSKHVANVIREIGNENIKFDIYMIKRDTLEAEDKLSLALALNDKVTILESISKFPWGVIFSEDFGMQQMVYEKLIDLPPEMTIGIEIESEGNSSGFIMVRFCYLNWTKGFDASLGNGIELQSPILHSTPEDSNQIYLVTAMLKGMGQGCSQRCGGHIHIGANYLKSAQAWDNLLELWCNTEAIQCTVCNVEGEPPRVRTVEYAYPIGKKVQNALEEGIINLDETSLSALKYQVRELQHKKTNLRNEVFDGYDRDWAINFENLTPYGTQTIEFRCPNGTLDPNLWIDNINWYGRIIAVSQELAEIMKLDKPNIEEKRKLELFEQIKQDVSNDEKFEILQELLNLDSEEYRKRYQSNIGFIKLDKNLLGGMVMAPVVIKPKDKPIITVDEISKATDMVSAMSELEAIRVMNEGARKDDRTITK